MLESSIEKCLRELLHQGGALCLKFISPGNPGVPDRIVVAPGGRVLFVELKSKTGRLSKVQKWQIERLRKIGAQVRVLTGMGQVKDFVKEVFDDEISAP